MFGPVEVFSTADRLAGAGQYTVELLADGAGPIETVAAECGFGTVETLRRALQRTVGASPSQYRERFTHRLSAA